MAVRGKYVHLIMNGGFVPWAVFPLQWAMAALGAVCPPQWAMAAPELERRKTRKKKKGRCVHLMWAMTRVVKFQVKLSLEVSLKVSLKSSLEVS